MRCGTTTTSPGRCGRDGSPARSARGDRLVPPGYADGGSLGQVLDTTLLVRPDVAVRAYDDGKRIAAEREALSRSEIGTSNVPPGEAGGDRPAPDRRGDGRDINQIVSAVLAQLAAGGFDEAKVRTVGENARTLRFTTYGFEVG